MIFEIIRPTREYADAVLKMRIDPVARAQSLTFTENQSLDEFFPKFLEKYFTIGCLPSLFIRKGEKRVSTLRFNRVEDGIEISIVIDESERGKGLGLQVLAEANGWLKERGVNDVIAKIKENNIASLRIFEKAGYQFYKKEDGILYHRLKLGEKKGVFIIAEAGSNWRTGDKDWERIETMIKGAKDAGADAIKFQLFKAEDVYAVNAGKADYLGEDVVELFKFLQIPEGWVEKIARACDGIEFMASPFSVRELKALDPYVKRHKIASYENHHIRLLEAAKATNKPLLVSTGTSTLEDIAWTVNFLKGTDLTLLQCTAVYPAPARSMNLEAIRSLKEMFHLPVGLSDHSQDPFTAPLGAVAMGATVIEKHFTLDRGLKGPDHKFAITLDELKKLVLSIRELEKMLGNGFKKVEEEENELLHFARRRLQATKAIKKGEKLQEGINYNILRPGKNRAGLDPSHIKKIEGTTAQVDYEAGEGI